MARACITASIFCLSNAVAYKGNGINMFIGWGGLNQKQLTELRSANMYFIFRQNALELSNLQEPLFYEWIHDDESDSAQINTVRSLRMGRYRDPVFFVGEQIQVHKSTYAACPHGIVKF